MKPAEENMQEHSPSSWSRRAFLGATATTTLGMTLPGQLVSRQGYPEYQCIFLVMLGGPSQIDTWDPKPNAPEEIRGPFRPIATTVPGLQISELFPRMARQAHRWNVIRSLFHEETPVHAAGLQLLQSGRFTGPGSTSFPCMGSVYDYLRGSKSGLPSHVVLPGPSGKTGSRFDCGQSSGHLGQNHQPLFAERACPTESQAIQSALTLSGESGRVQSAYGHGRLARNCLQARRLIERGIRLVTVNLFSSVFGQPSWDIHGHGPFASMDDMATVVAPEFDQACSRLIEDLEDRGLLKTTIVVAAGEFGRSPRINPHGGRDHHAGVWSLLLAGGPFGGGKVIGASDASGAEPNDRPVRAPEVVATLYKALGIPPHTIIPGVDGRPTPLIDLDIQPIRELL